MNINQELEFSEYRKQYNKWLINMDELKNRYFEIFISPEIKNKTLEYAHR